jgi:hypothetical protein
MSHEKNPPTLPKVVDEASDTKAWVPILGLGLLATVAITVALRFAIADNAGTDAKDGAQAAGDTAVQAPAAPKQAVAVPPAH